MAATNCIIEAKNNGGSYGAEEAISAFLDVETGNNLLASLAGFLNLC